MTGGSTSDLGRSCSNIYADEAHRPRAIEVREKIFNYIRSWFCNKSQGRARPPPAEAVALLPLADDHMVFTKALPAFAVTLSTHKTVIKRVVKKDGIANTLMDITADLGLVCRIHVPPSRRWGECFS